MIAHQQIFHILQIYKNILIFYIYYKFYSKNSVKSKQLILISKIAFMTSWVDIILDVTSFDENMLWANCRRTHTPMS